MLLAELPRQLFDPTSQELCEAAVALATEAQHHAYDDVHLFAAIMAQEEDFMPAYILRRLDFDYEAVLRDAEDTYGVQFKLIPQPGNNFSASIAHAFFFTRQRHREELVTPADLLGGIIRNRSPLIQRAIDRSGNRAEVVLASLQLHNPPVIYRS